MKLEAKFYSKENKLYFLDGNELPTESCLVVDSSKLDGCSSSKLYCVNVDFSQIGTEDDGYDEEFLAKLRDFLKALEEKSEYAFINSIHSVENPSEIKKEEIVASFKHCARRIKDCENVIGFSIPKNISSSMMMDEFAKKHAQYIYFSQEDSVLENLSIVKF